MLLLIKSPVDNENERLRLTFAIPTGVSITFANDAIEILALALLIKQLKTYQTNPKNQYTC